MNRRAFEQQQKTDLPGGRRGYKPLKSNQWRKNDRPGMAAVYKCGCGGASALRKGDVDASGCATCFNCGQPMLLEGFAACGSNLAI